MSDKATQRPSGRAAHALREVRITRQGLEISGYSDIEYRRKKVRMAFEGTCQTP